MAYSQFFQQLCYQLLQMYLEQFDILCHITFQGLPSHHFDAEKQLTAGSHCM